MQWVFEAEKNRAWVEILIGSTSVIWPCYIRSKDCPRKTAFQNGPYNSTPKISQIVMFVCNQEEILMFVGLQKDAKQCCDTTKLDHPHCDAQAE